MAAVTTVWGIDIYCEVRTRYFKTMVRPVVNTHIRSSRHMTLNTRGPGADVKEQLAICRFDGFSLFPLFFMEMMFLCVVFVSPVALKTKIISLLDQFCTVYIMTISAAHIPMIHLALCE